MGGEYTHTLTIEEMPEHTHTRGTMDITGRFICYSQYNKSSGDSYFNSGGAVGAFHKYDDNMWMSGHNDTTVTNDSDAARQVAFTASRTWTGETSSSGNGKPHNILPPYICTNIWKRIA